jgi:acyl-coenzyme A synthetase/AMP-(fatty) acid ligase
LSRSLPLLANHGSQAPIAWRDGRAISPSAFLSHVRQTAERLPAGAYAINLCENRYHFLVGFAAALLRGQITLLPPNRAEQMIADIARTYPESYCLVERPHQELAARQHTIEIHEPPGEDSRLPEIAQDAIAAIAFTSGSTAKARPNPKRFSDLVLGAYLAQHRFGITRERVATIVATVPAQHMYGLETSIMLPLVSGVAFHSGRPFFPEDIRAALTSVAAPALLITTPIHLRACLESGVVAWPQLYSIISATAPLCTKLAQRAEQRFGCPVLEIYGCTEAGSIASRRTREEELWRLYDGLSLSKLDGGCYVSGPPLPEPVHLHDRLEIKTASHFKLLGRDSDIINLAGKRASLEDLNHRLRAIPGVYDGTFLVLPEETTGVARLAALVVAPALRPSEILAALAKGVDPVFLPRPLFKVERLPRNPTGKLPRAELLGLLARLRAGT